MDEYSLQRFEPHVESQFQIIINGQPALDLKLVEVEDLTIEDRLRDESIRSQPFSLIFHGPLSPVAEQMVYNMGHSELGDLQMFLVPIGPDRKLRTAMRYQAIFN